jgi:hypothetical protein
MKPEIKRSMGELGRKAALERFSTSDVVQKYVDLYRRICAK